MLLTRTRSKLLQIKWDCSFTIQLEYWDKLLKKFKMEESHDKPALLGKEKAES